MSPKADRHLDPYRPIWICFFNAGFTNCRVQCIESTSSVQNNHEWCGTIELSKKNNLQLAGTNGLWMSPNSVPRKKKREYNLSVTCKTFTFAMHLLQCTFCKFCCKSIIETLILKYTVIVHPWPSTIMHENSLNLRKDL